MEHYPAIVVGLGGMGSAALAQLALRGVRALGLEQNHPAHALGSSHGGSRIIRKAYFEDPAYVPLLLRAYELWHQLEARTGSTLLLPTGGLMAGVEGGEIVAGALRSAREHGLAHEFFTAAELRRRFPMVRPRGDEVAVYEPDAGVLFPEACILAHLQAAVAAGAEARFGVRVRNWRTLDGGAVVETETGEIACDRLILTAGPWLGLLAPAIGPRLQVERNVMHWFDPAEGAPDLGPGALPIYILERSGERVFYGIPNLPGQGLKVAFHYSGRATDPETVERTVSTAEVKAMQGALHEWIPAAAGSWRRSEVCLYTNTPDLHFIIGAHPSTSGGSVLLAGGFSGHGFKFCSVVGEILADLALTGATRHDIRLFTPERMSI